MYEPSRRIASFYVAGFQRYGGVTVFDGMEVGFPIEMVPEPDAVMLRLGGVKVGYVPREETGLIPLLSFYEHEGVFEARVIQADTREAPWKQVRVGIAED